MALVARTVSSRAPITYNTAVAEVHLPAAMIVSTLAPAAHNSVANPTRVECGVVPGAAAFITAANQLRDSASGVLPERRWNNGTPS